MTSEMERLDKHRSQVRTRSGTASYVDTGGPGRPVLFVHGVGSSSYLWRNVIGQLDGERRCVAVDLLTSLHARDLLAAEPALRRLQVPTLIVWGTGDLFFRRKWAYWLRDTIPGATEVVELDGARLFFPDERAAELTAALRRHWDAHT
jgi:pimeloyl-ACP methyl ester carboxylesterase